MVSGLGVASSAWEECGSHDAFVAMGVVNVSVKQIKDDRAKS